MKTVQHLVSVSGGKDSTATYLKAIESGRPFSAVFADTGNEHEITLEYVATLAPCTVGLWSKRDRAMARPSISKREFEATPPAFGEWLVELARRCATNRMQAAA